MLFQIHKFETARCVPILVVAASLALAGCYATTGGGYVGEYGYYGAPVATDDYLYYPGAEVYYNTTRHQYWYRDHDRWRTQAAPPSYWRSGMPSVPMNFHDSPAYHHSQVIRQYPRNWAPDNRRDRDHDRDNDRR